MGIRGLEWVLGWLCTGGLCQTSAKNKAGDGAQHNEEHRLAATSWVLLHGPSRVSFNPVCVLQSFEEFSLSLRLQFAI
jgi:hypothetical protein